LSGGGKDKEEALRRCVRLGELVQAYGDMLIAYELDRPLPSLIPPLTASGQVTKAQASVLLKDVLQRGGVQLVADFEELARAARQSKDPEVLAAVDRVRQALRHTARYNGAALAHKVETVSESDPAARFEAESLRKEVQAFLEAVGRAIPMAEPKIEEIFPDDDAPASESEDR